MLLMYMGDLGVVVSSQRLLMVMTYDFSDMANIFGWGNFGGGGDDVVC